MDKFGRPTSGRLSSFLDEQQISPPTRPRRAASAAPSGDVRNARAACRTKGGKHVSSWMCATCVVPLCVDVSNGDRESSCHARWHKCLDLVALNETLNSSLRERRTSRKRSRATADDTIARWGALRGRDDDG